LLCIRHSLHAGAPWAGAVTFTARLKAMGLDRAKLAARLGLSREQVSRWKDNPPQYALAYLDALGEAEALRKRVVEALG
jgi:transcriptional regulator with XRE-family HTH domain